MQSSFQLQQISTPTDYEIFKGLLREYAARDLADPQNSSIWKDIEQLPGRYAAPEGGVILATAGDTLAGCGAFVASDHTGLVELKRVYVRSDFRRQGLARALTLALLAEVRQLGYQTAGICTWPHNTQALALYEELGFAPVAPFREHAHAHLIFLGLPLGKTIQDTNSTHS